MSEKVFMNQKDKPTSHETKTEKLRLDFQKVESN